ncbi:betaine-aldehyde dehydrogenase [Salinisphaera hydrothermalis]|uniref:Betaine-aldehyde dehydrogenase n=1 Tax=Salinisphaera hydrothermalis (strain C41B8) TaxID=1304275 RepID=A0A084IJH4_SALHC|nr:betaine-aldehyde dehydrogenase [Salinisphaera hydrothermalis]KEZ76858.1 TetR family transcriptional regulator [Salinisphaera hydrothermalis C41B8]
MTASSEQKLLWIDGAYVAAKSGEFFDTVNPATGELLAQVSKAGEADIDAAVAAARAALGPWKAMSGVERGRILHRLSQLLREHRDELARLEMLDGGKPIAETPEADVDSGADCLEYFAGQASSIQGEYQEVDGGFFYTRPEPLGVVGAIGAWNYPLQIACWKSAPALAAGNTVVFKPSELTPLSALRLAELAKEAGLPDGVLNIVQGFGDAGQALSHHAGIDKISLTGGADTGKKVMADAASTLKTVSLELGGKSPLVIFDDADLDNAVSGALLANFFTQGEICTNGTRVFVHESVREAFLEKLVARVEKLKIGNPADADTDVGPMISPEHGQIVLDYIEAGKSGGAKLVIGGEQVAVDGCDHGVFIQPTVFDACTDDMKIVNEEIFGPVMSVLSFTDEAEVIERANNTEFGLAAGVFTRDLERAHRVIGELEAGICWINHYNITPIEMPFGGIKGSGIGKENSRRALEHYVRIKSVFVARGAIDAPY